MPLVPANTDPASLGEPMTFRDGRRVLPPPPRYGDRRGAEVSESLDPLRGVYPDGSLESVRRCAARIADDYPRLLWRAELIQEIIESRDTAYLWTVRVAAGGLLFSAVTFALGLVIGKGL